MHLSLQESLSYPTACLFQSVFDLTLFSFKEKGYSRSPLIDAKSTQMIKVLYLVRCRTENHLKMSSFIFQDREGVKESSRDQ